ncbi:MAG: hypothetical protein EXQ81_03980 [Thermoleophilia bacterium]|nr:hypothetical protein [Thermoleophilia bacterium]
MPIAPEPRARVVGTGRACRAVVVARLQSPGSEWDAVGSPAELQGKTATTDGPARFTAPSVVFEHTGRRLVAGGWQTIEAYDVLVAHLIPDGDRRGVPDDPLELLERFPGGVTTQEVAHLLTRGNDASDRTDAEAAMLGLVARGAAVRTQVGDDALWRSAS